MPDGPDNDRRSPTTAGRRLAAVESASHPEPCRHARSCARSTQEHAPWGTALSTSPDPSNPPPLSGQWKSRLRHRPGIQAIAISSSWIYAPEPGSPAPRDREDRLHQDVAAGLRHLNHPTRYESRLSCHPILPHLPVPTGVPVTTALTSKKHPPSGDGGQLLAPRIHLKLSL